MYHVIPFLQLPTHVYECVEILVHVPERALLHVVVPPAKVLQVARDVRRGGHDALLVAVYLVVGEGGLHLCRELTKGVAYEALVYAGSNYEIQ